MSEIFGQNERWKKKGGGEINVRFDEMNVRLEGKVEILARGEGSGLVVAIHELSLYEASALVSRSFSMKLVH